MVRAVAEHRLLKDILALSNGVGGCHQVEDVLLRFGGDLDVIVSYEAPGAEKRFTGYRSGDDGWRQLNASWRDHDTAREQIGSVLGYAVLAYQPLVELLDLAKDGAK